MDLTPATMEKANEAIAQLVSLFGLDQGKAEAIRSAYGSATYSLVYEVYRFAMDYPIDWSIETHKEAVASVRKTLKQTYPFLTEPSIRRLEDCFAYSWR